MLTELWSDLRYRLRALFRRGTLEQALDAELRYHLDREAEKYEQAGLPPAEARRRSRLAFGGVERFKEESREARGMVFVESIVQDLRSALHGIRAQPGFAAAVLLTLALGIGATTAVFTLVEQVMLRPLPVARPDQLWRIGAAVRCCHANGYAQNDWSIFSWEAYERFRDHTPAFAKLAALQVGQAELGVRRVGSSAPAEPLSGEYVSGNFFETFGILPWRGRLFIEPDDRKGAPPVAVMSFHTWQDRFGSDPSVIGATYEINGHPFTVVGVAAPGFFGAKSAGNGMPDFWLPLATEPLLAGATSRLENPEVGWLDLIGRVRPGTNPKALEAQLQVELRQWLAGHVPDMIPQERALQARQTLHLSPGGAGVPLMRESYADGLRLLLLAALCVLLVACANIANLLLARGLRDRHQTALRAALGASRARLVRRALVESLTLGVLGGLAGIGVAYGGASLILHLAFGGSDSWVPVDASPSTPVLLFAVGISLAAGVVFGVAPAWATSRADPIEALYGASRTVGGARHWAQKTLVIVQVVASLVLLSAAAMLGQSLRNRKHGDFGFDPSGRYLVSINSMLANYGQERMVPLLREVEDRLRAIPGVRTASPVLYAPLSGYSWDRPIRVEGQPEPGPSDDVSSAWTRVTPGFFETLGDRIVQGRPFTDADDADTRPVAVVNQAFAKKFFGSESPIGKRFGPGPRTNAGTYEIVGVAADVRYFANPTDPVEPMYFVPEAQTTHFDQADLEGREIWSHYPYDIVISAPGHPSRLEAQVKAALAEAAPGIVVYGVWSYADVIHYDFAKQNMIASLTWLFGALALVLAAVGLYGVTAYGVEQRTGEVGVRMALGADRRSVVAMVLGGAFSQVAIGLALGIPAAIGGGHLIAGQLFGVTPWDGRMLFGATLLLAVAALTAAVIPARRAAGVSPMQALRGE